MTTQPPQITIRQLTPISQFENTGLQESINKALAGVEQGHGHALLNIDNGGAGVMVAERFKNLGKLEWGIAFGARYSFTTKKPEVQVSLTGSW